MPMVSDPGIWSTSCSSPRRSRRAARPGSRRATSSGVTAVPPGASGCRATTSAAPRGASARSSAGACTSASSSPSSATSSRLRRPRRSSP